MTREWHGFLVLDKPSGITSRDAVNRAQKWFPPRARVGHTGTLDPLATGVLVLCLGQATRLAEYVQEMDKSYRTIFHLGARSDTDDADGTVIPTAGVTHVDEALLRTTIQSFVGDIEQKPPAFSAIKIAGKRAHELARRGDPADIAPRTISVYQIDFLRYEWPELELEIRCGKGTYIRSLARDLGERLGCGAYVTMLRRVRVGPFRCENAATLGMSAEEARARLLPPATAVAHFPPVVLDDEPIKRLRQGQVIAGIPAEDAPLCSLFDQRNQLIGIGTVQAGTLRSVKNLTVP